MEWAVEMDMSKFLWTLGIRLQPLALGRHTVVGDLSLLICSSEFFVQVFPNFGRLRLKMVFGVLGTPGQSELRMGLIHESRPSGRTQ